MSHDRPCLALLLVITLAAPQDAAQAEVKLTGEAVFDDLSDRPLRGLPFGPCDVVEHSSLSSSVEIFMARIGRGGESVLVEKCNGTVIASTLLPEGTFGNHTYFIIPESELHRAVLDDEYFPNFKVLIR